MIRKLLAATLMMFVALGVLSAETLKGKITKIAGDKVTFAEVEDPKAKPADRKFKDAKELTIAKDCKVCKMVKKEKTEVADGLKAEALTTIGDKGLYVTINTNDDKKVTEIILGGGKK